MSWLFAAQRFVFGPIIREVGSFPVYEKKNPITVSKQKKRGKGQRTTIAWIKDSEGSCTYLRGIYRKVSVKKQRALPQVEVKISTDLDRKGRVIAKRYEKGKLIRWVRIGNSAGRRMYTWYAGSSHPYCTKYPINVECAIDRILEGLPKTMKNRLMSNFIMGIGKVANKPVRGLDLDGAISVFRSGIKIRKEKRYALIDETDTPVVITTSQDEKIVTSYTPDDDLPF